MPVRWTRIEDVVDADLGLRNVFQPEAGLRLALDQCLHGPILSQRRESLSWPRPLSGSGGRTHVPGSRPPPVPQPARDDTRHGGNGGGRNRRPHPRGPDVRRPAGPLGPPRRDDPCRRRHERPRRARGPSRAPHVRLRQREEPGRARQCGRAAPLAGSGASSRQPHVLPHRPEREHDRGVRAGRPGQRAVAPDVHGEGRLALAALPVPARGGHDREAAGGAAVPEAPLLQGGPGDAQLRRLGVQRSLRAVPGEERPGVGRVAEGGVRAPGVRTPSRAGRRRRGASTATTSPTSCCCTSARSRR